MKWFIVLGRYGLAYRGTRYYVDFNQFLLGFRFFRVPTLGVCWTMIHVGPLLIDTSWEWQVRNDAP